MKALAVIAIVIAIVTGIAVHTVGNAIDKAQAHNAQVISAIEGR